MRPVNASGGADAVKLDDLATPDDNADLDATTGVHGLLPKLGGGTTNYLRADGSWAAPAGGGGGDVATDTIFDAKGDLAVGTGADTAAKRTVGANGTVLTADSTEATGVKWSAQYAALGVVLHDPAVDDQLDIEVPFDCTITGVTLLADTSGSIVVDIWKDTYADFPPVDADSITASAPPTLSSAAKSQDTTLTGWTTSLSKGDILRFNVDSVATVTRVLVQLGVTR